MIYRLTSGQILNVRQGFLQSTANPITGNSGGAFLNERGEVVGLIAWKTQFLSQKKPINVKSSRVNGSHSYGAVAAVLRQMLQAYFVSYYPTG